MNTIDGDKIHFEGKILMDPLWKKLHERKN